MMFFLLCLIQQCRMQEPNRSPASRLDLAQLLPPDRPLCVPRGRREGREDL